MLNKIQKHQDGPRKIALVANTTWNIYNFRQNIIRKFLDEGWEVVVIAPVDEYITYRDNFPNVLHMDIKYLDRDNVNPTKEIRLFFELKRIYKKVRPDLVIHYTHKPNIYGGIASGQLGIPSVAVITGLGYSFIHGGWILSVLKILYAQALKKHLQIIFENEDDRILFEMQKLLPKEKGISIKGCGVDTNHFRPIQNQSNGKMVFSFLGRLLYDKGIIEFVEAAKQIKAKKPDTRFWVIGEFDEDNPSSIDKNKLVEYIDEGIIEYKGFAKDVRKLISQSDFIVLPSYREGMSKVLLEAMSMGKPIITSDVPGCRETVIDGLNGFLAKPRSIESLVKQLQNTIELPNRNKLTMGEESRKMVLEKFTSDQIANQLYDIVTSVLRQA